MIDRIAIDLDDTLNSLTMHVLHRLGCDVGPFEYEKYPKEMGYDMVGAWAKLCDRDPVPVPMFWEWVGRTMWEDAPASKEFWLLRHCGNLVGRRNVLIATAPTKSADCLFGKYQWMQQHLPEWAHRQYSITPRKHWLARPGVLLIDDADKNVDDFRACGGDAILVPRPWNSMSGEHTGDYLASEFEKRDYVFSSEK